MGHGIGIVLLALAGSCAGSTIAPGDQRVPASEWGGDHVGLTVTEAGAHVEFDCAHGDIGQPLIVDSRGNLAVDGVYVQERPGPVRIGEDPDKKPARYAGRVDGSRMTLSVTLKDSNEAIGTFTLTRGAASGVHKCL